MNVCAKSVLPIVLGKLTIPPFTIGRGEIISFCWPYIMGGKEEQKFISLLRKDISISGLVVNDELAIVSSFSVSLIEQEIQLIPDIKNLLTELSEKYQDQLYSAYVKKSKINELAATLRLLVSIHMASLRYSFVLFNCAGLDPLGEASVVEYVGKKAEQGIGFLLMQFPTFGKASQVSKDNVIIQKIFPN
jgi:hypothetical protein